MEKIVGHKKAVLVTAQRSIAVSLTVVLMALAYGCAHHSIPIGARDDVDHSSNSGLTLDLVASGKRYETGSEYTLDVTVSNRSDQAVTLWLRRNNFDILTLELDHDGRNVWGTFPKAVSFHDFGAWADDIFDLAAGTSRTQTWRLGRNVPGTLQLRARYANREHTLKANNWKLKFPEQFEYRSNVWTGVLYSNPVVIEFYGGRDLSQ